MVMASLLSAACMEMGFCVLTISTLTPFDNIGVMTMKMMSRTSITSTMGVTLISATGGGAFALMITDIIKSPTQAGSGAARLEPGRPYSTRRNVFGCVGYLRAAAPRCDRFRK